MVTDVVLLEHAGGAGGSEIGKIRVYMDSLRLSSGTNWLTCYVLQGIVICRVVNHQICLIN